VRVEKINASEAHPLILNVHYARRLPSISYAFGLFRGNEMSGVVTYGMPASPFVCSGICGEAHKGKVLELNRLVLRNNRKNEASFLISNSIKQLPKPSIVVSYADTDRNHSGCVYQASNFYFAGTSTERTDIDPGEGKHARHHLGDATARVRRSPKHRYFFIHGSKSERKTLMSALLWKIESAYPKRSGEAVIEPVEQFEEQMRLCL
jgi:hypothetical protein